MSTHENNPLQRLENLIKTQFGELCVSLSLSYNQTPYISIWQQAVASECFMKFLPLFHVIGFIKDNGKLVLQLITFHGKVLEEMNENESNKPMAEDDQINFVGRLTQAKLCQGVKRLENNLKLDPETFTFLFLVEQLEENIIVRSRNCQFVLYNGNSTCEMCLNLCKEEVNSKHGTDAGEVSDMCQDMESSHKDLQEIRNCITGLDNESLYTRKNYQVHEYPIDRESQIFPEESFQENSTKDATCVDRNKTCRNCSFASSSLNILIRHIQVSHKEVKYFKCKLCAFDCKFKKTLLRHVSETHNTTKNVEIKDYKCKECNYVAKTKRSLNAHVSNAHEGPKPFDCAWCGYKTVSNHKLTEHINAVHNKIKRFLCDFCTYDTAIKGNLSRHIRDVHEGIKLFKCEQCAFQASQKVHLMSHIRSVHDEGPLEKIKPFQCDQCSFRFTQKSVLANHIKTVHEKIKPFLCDFCTFSTATKHLLRQHIEVIHEKKKEFKCTQCSYEASRKHYLKEHIQSVHENIKRFSILELNSVYVMQLRTSISMFTSL